MTSECVREYKDLPYCHVAAIPFLFDIDCKKEFGSEWKYGASSKSDCGNPFGLRGTCMKEYKPRYEQQ